MTDVNYAARVASRAQTSALQQEDAAGGGTSSSSVDEFFTQARTGQLINPDAVLKTPWTLSAGQSFTRRSGDMRVQNRPTRNRRATITQIMAQLYQLDEDSLVHLQHSLLEAGLIEGRPSWGKVDEATRSAIRDLAMAAAADPSRDMGIVLRQLASNRPSDSEILDALGTTGDPMDAAHQANMTQTLQPIEVSDPNVLRETADDVAQTLLGRNLTPEERKKVFASIQGKERGLQKRQQQYDLASADYQSALSIQSEGSGGGGAEGGGDVSKGASEVDSFMNAIAVGESGGNYNAYNSGSGATGKYQILRKYWSSWAREAGLPGNAPMSPENQDRVAKYKMLTYYKKYGNWRDVAIAWYGGAGGVQKAHAGKGDGDQRGYPSINRYADAVMARMGQGGGAAQPSGADAVLAGGPPAPFEYTDVNPDAEAAAFIRKNDPKGWGGHQFAQQAAEFSELLAGLPEPG